MLTDDPLFTSAPLIDFVYAIIISMSEHAQKMHTTGKEDRGGMITQIRFFVSTIMVFFFVLSLIFICS